MDVRDLDQVRSAVDATVAGLGRLDILVNNAGLAPGNPAEDVTEADFDLTVQVNLKGTFFASQAAGQEMIGQGYGRIVNLGSQARAVAWPTESVYCMTKATISRLTKFLAVEWGRRGVTVNTVAPTFIRTPGDRASAGRSVVPRRRRGADRRAAPLRGTDGRGRRGGVPGLPGREPDHRDHSVGRRRLDRAVARRACWRRQAR
jgi:NAD(P)-dependent dehydrogenase (short-subunit alcohol dehydrogenase family)